MKCPACGQWNRASFPRCVKCGAKLNIDEASRNAWRSELHEDGQGKSYIRVDEFGNENHVPDRRDVLAHEMHDLKERKTEGEEAQSRLKRRRIEQDVSPIRFVRDDNGQSEQTKTPPAANNIRSGSSDARENYHRMRIIDENGQIYNARAYDEQFDTSTYDRTTDRTIGSVSLAGLASKKQQRRKKTKKFLCVLASLLLIAAGIRFLPALLKTGETNNAGEREPIINATILNELSAHEIKIPGEDGSQIYIRELHSSYMVIDGYATIEVADHTWYDNYEGSLDDTMNVTLTPFLKNASGTQTPLPVINYEIDIPLSPITLESPDSLRTTVATTMSAIRIVVRPGSKVTVNGNDFSDTVSTETGEMSYNATVQPIGDNTYTFVVRSQYCRDNTLVVTLYREPQEIPLDLAVGTYGTTNKSTMKVTATTLPGAYVEVLSPYADLDITNLDTTGKFTFNAVFDSIGYNTIIIESSYAGKKTSRVEHQVYYLPPASEYTVKAWPLSEDGYSELLSNISVRAERHQVYLVTGVVQYEVSEKPQRVVINTSEDGKSRPVLVENFTNTEWKVGTYYRLYADAYNTYNSMPWLYARYTYLK